MHVSQQKEISDLLKANLLHHCLPKALPKCCSKPPSHHGSSNENPRQDAQVEDRRLMLTCSDLQLQVKALEINTPVEFLNSCMLLTYNS